MSFPSDLLDRIAACPIMAVLLLEEPDDAPALGEALIKGGIRGIELTLRSSRALEGLEKMVSTCPDLVVGAGTVLSPGQVAAVKAAGAAFAVSPGFNPRVVGAAREAGLPFAPGICTPSDIEGALEFDCTALKFFPAETSGGLKHLKNMAAPYLHRGVRFIPLGGLNESNMLDYLADPLIAAIGGSWLAPKPLLAARDWAAIEKNARTAVDRWRSAIAK
jgi:2-dehydro-3-deoxyphosphogluconate aldolase/(4S)-4-hydroxy-2-oxoglutarate aldolase